MTFVDANGIVNVSARIWAPATPSTSPSRPPPTPGKEDIETVKDAEQYAAEDAKIREGGRSPARPTRWSVRRKTLNEVGDKVPESEEGPSAGVEKLERRR